VAASLDRITRRAHTLSQLLEDGISIRAADMPGADDLMLLLRIYAAMAQKERELISERTRAALAAERRGGRCWAATEGIDPPRARARARWSRRGHGVRQRNEQRTGWFWRLSGCGPRMSRATRRWRGC